jgi:hypothetical protein
MTIPALPAAPLPTDTPSEFNSKAFAFLAALDPWGDAVDLATTAINTDATTASTAASTATTKAGEASASASSAATSATTASNAATSAVASFDSFDVRYLGAKSADPTLDNDGNALLTGALYFNSSSGSMRVWTGSAWATAYIPASGYLTTGDIGTTIQAYDADLTAWAGKTAPAGAAVGTTDAQTLTNKTIRQMVSVISTNTTAAPSTRYVMTATLTLTLPASPVAGDWVAFSNRSATSTPVIARNGQNIMGLAEDMTLDNVNHFGVLVYADATRGWIFN